MEDRDIKTKWILENRAKRIREVYSEEMQAEATWAIERMKKAIDELMEASHIELPVSLLDILSKGGEVKVLILSCPEHFHSGQAHIGIQTSGQIFNVPLPFSGDQKFRLILIAVQIEEEKASITPGTKPEAWETWKPTGP